jgi:23S rRNA (adenine-N6)-dimethyltransferase
MAHQQRSTLWRTQNFLRSSVVLDPVLAGSGIQPRDLVLDIGAGTGTVTASLRAHGARVIAIEQDPRLCARLRDAFGADAQVTIECGDFLRARLPSTAYKVFASPPFDVTTAIVTKLTEAASAPEDAFLVVQLEAARRYIGHPSETLYALLLKPWFEPQLVHSFRRRDFTPAPAVDVVMLRLRKRGPPLIEPAQRQLYRDFVVAAFTAWRPSVRTALVRAIGSSSATRTLGHAGLTGSEKPSQVAFAGWLAIFEAFVAMTPDVTRRVLSAEERLRAQQRRLRKVHRTRAPRDDPGEQPMTAAWVDTVKEHPF